MLVYIKESDEIFYIDYRSKSPLNSNLENIFDIINRHGKPYDTVPKDFDYDLFDLLDEGYKASAFQVQLLGCLMPIHVLVN